MLLPGSNNIFGIVREYLLQFSFAFSAIFENIKPMSRFCWSGVYLTPNPPPRFKTSATNPCFAFMSEMNLNIMSAASMKGCGSKLCEPT